MKANIKSHSCRSKALPLKVPFGAMRGKGIAGVGVAMLRER